MALGTVTKYNGMVKQLLDTSNRQWNDAAAGNIMFCLCGNGYTPSAAHSTTADLLDLIASGDGAPIAATTLSLDSTTLAGTTYLKSDNADFGAAVTISAKWLICVQPVTAGTFSATTSVLLWYVDLDNTSGTAELASTASDFVIVMPTTPNPGWIRLA